MATLARSTHSRETPISASASARLGAWRAAIAARCA
jgi:hypothetical protein